MSQLGALLHSGPALSEPERLSGKTEGIETGGIENMRLVLSDDLALESRSEDGVVVVNLATAARMQMSSSAYAFMKSFATPRRLGQMGSPDVVARLLPQIRRLVERRMLIDADALPGVVERRRATVAHRFCAAPAFRAATPPDFVVLGVPYDLAGTVESRCAPALLRQKSLEFPYQLGVDDGCPQGWFDVNRGTRILRGATLADAGDVPVDYGESRDRYAARVETALDECCGAASVPVVLGGDRSATAAVIRALRQRGRVQLVEVTARPERSVAEGRDLLRSNTDSIDRVIGVGPALLQQADAAAMVRAKLAPDCPIHLSVDLTISSGLASLHELKNVITAIGSGHRITGVDLVGLDTRSRARDVIIAIACQIALTAMDANYARR